MAFAPSSKDSSHHSVHPAAPCGRRQASGRMMQMKLDGPLTTLAVSISIDGVYLVHGITYIVDNTLCFCSLYIEPIGIIPDYFFAVTYCMPQTIPTIHEFLGHVRPRDDLDSECARLRYGVFASDSADRFPNFLELADVF